MMSRVHGTPVAHEPQVELQPHTAEPMKGLPMTRHKRVDWHSAAVDAIKIDLRDYADVLEYQSEYPLSRNAHRIDLLIIRKLCDTPIPKDLCRHFREFNIFEIRDTHLPHNECLLQDGRIRRAFHRRDRSPRPVYPQRSHPEFCQPPLSPSRAEASSGRLQQNG